MSYRKRLVAALTVALPLASEAASEKPAPRPTDLIDTYQTMDDLCRGTGSPMTQQVACADRDKLYPIIKAQGWCNGLRGQPEEDRRWHRCTARSL